jgi:8-oxo-dGTP diphosphatase
MLTNSTSTLKITPIAIALVRRGNDYLVGTRTPGQVLAGQAEFPGGKMEPGESASAAAVRECLEETGLSVRPVRLLLEQRHCYQHATVQLHFWLCEPLPGQETLALAGNFAWVAADQLRAADFPAANGPLMNMLELK